MRRSVLRFWTAGPVIGDIISRALAGSDFLLCPLSVRSAHDLPLIQPSPSFFLHFSATRDKSLNGIRRVPLPSSLRQICDRLPSLAVLLLSSHSYACDACKRLRRWLERQCPRPIAAPASSIVLSHLRDRALSRIELNAIHYITALHHRPVCAHYAIALQMRISSASHHRSHAFQVP